MDHHFGGRVLSNQAIPPRGAESATVPVMIPANAHAVRAQLPADVRGLLDPLGPALQRDLALSPYAPPLGLLVFTGPPPQDVLLDDLHGEPERLHAAYPLFGLQAVALRYARDVARTLWDDVPFGFVWCLVVWSDRACVVPVSIAHA